jgi:hypothetical protein
VKPNINSVELHPQLSNNGHPVDGALVGAAFTVAPLMELHFWDTTVLKKMGEMKFLKLSSLLSSILTSFLFFKV